MRKFTYSLSVLFLGLILVGAGCSQSADVNTDAEVNTEASGEQTEQREQEGSDNEEGQRQQGSMDDSEENAGEEDSQDESETGTQGEAEINAEADVNVESETSVESENEEEETQNESEVKVVSVSGDEFSFSPSTITAEEGQKVKINFTNEGKVAHDLKIPSLGVGTSVIEAGATESFTFTAKESGTYPMEFECTVPGHAEQGMVGKIVVE